MKKMNAKTITYRSAVDGWMIISLVVVVFSSIGVGIYLLPSNVAAGIALIVGGSVVSIWLWLGGFPCNYTLTESDLVIRAGLLWKREINFDRIKNVSLSNNPTTMPAWSMKRVEIEYEGRLIGFVLISPEDRETFMKELDRRRKTTD